MDMAERMLFQRDLDFLKRIRSQVQDDQSEIAMELDRQVEELEEVLFEER